VAVRIRLRRIGKKKQPQYRLVAADSAGPRDGRFLEVIGHYNPRVDPPTVSVLEDRALWWLRQGAQPSDTARSLLTKTGVWQKFTGEASPSQSPTATDVAAPAPEATSLPPEETPAEQDSSASDAEAEKDSE
jgi:small subunit ribosomal protein S16